MDELYGDFMLKKCIELSNPDQVFLNGSDPKWIRSKLNRLDLG